MDKSGSRIWSSSLETEKLFQRKKNERRVELQKAVDYCRQNNCRGYKALHDLDMKYVKSPLTINNALDGKVCPEHRLNSKRCVCT